MMKSKVLIAAACLVAFGTTSSACFADTMASCETAGNFTIVSGANMAVCAPPDQSASANEPGDDYWFRSENAAARADYGILGVKGSGLFSGYIKPSEAGGGNTSWQNEAYFRDLLTITGTPFDGSLAFTLQLTGSESLTGRGDFYSPFAPQSGVATNLYASGLYTESDFVITGPEEVTAIFPFYAGNFGDDRTLTIGFEFDLVSYGECGISGEGSCLVQANFYDTAQVTGYTLSGNPDASISFASGTDYNNIPGDVYESAPEPATGTIMLAGFLGLGASVRRRKSSTEPST